MELVSDRGEVCETKPFRSHNTEQRIQKGRRDTSGAGLGRILRIRAGFWPRPVGCESKPMQILRPNPMAQAPPKRSAATDPTLFAAPSTILCGHRCPSAVCRRALLPSGARNTTRNFTGQ